MILLVIGISCFSLLFAIYLARYVIQREMGTANMQEISNAIKEGAEAFLSRQNRTIITLSALLAVLIFVLYAYVRTPNPADPVPPVELAFWTTVAFVLGAACSVIAGYIGMWVSIRANIRTASAVRSSLNQGLQIAMRGGAVSGLFVVAMSLLGVGGLYALLEYLGHDPQKIPFTIVGYGFGASFVALFAQLGGGIYTKAADVGADLVGKVEAGIPEDDPRNPAVIADLVGDNVGDVAGMGADLFESYVGAIVSGMIIAAATLPPEKQLSGVTLALLLAAVGIVASIVGTFFVRTEKGDPQTALRNGTMASAILSIVGSFFIIWGWYGEVLPFWAFLSGVVVGMAIGFVAEYYTSGEQVEELAQFCRTGAATNIIQGMGLSYRSTVIPLVLIALAIIISFQCAGFFGIALSAIGMLSIAGITVAVDAYGPISDNAGGIAEMAHMERHVRQITDSLDAAGNTTAAIAKGFAIGSAALTALALFASYIQAAGLDKIDIMNANVVAGLFIGGIVPFLFAGDGMRAVGRAAFGVVEEVRRQCKEIHGLMEGTARAAYARCVDITTTGALKEMVAPGILAVAIPVGLGIVLGPDALGGMLAGALVSGVPLALQLANAGWAWDNAKKYIEAGNLGGKGSEAHKAAVVGDTVGDPFKDTAGPSLHILVKLLSTITLVIAPLLI